MIREDRLFKLAGHLNGGILGHESFDFSIVSEGERLANGCGSAGCALGEMPVVFPLDWSFTDPETIGGRIGYTVTIDGHEHSGTSAVEFFGITEDEYCGLFLPDMEPAPWNEFVLGDNANRYDVAEGILNFIFFKRNQESLRAQDAEVAVLA